MASYRGKKASYSSGLISAIDSLLEQIEIAESELEEQKEARKKFEEDEDFDHTEDLAEIRIDIFATERNLKYLLDRLKLEQSENESS